MKRTSLVVAGFSAMLALGLMGYGCTSSDTVSGTGGSTGSGSGGSTTTTGAGGSTTTTGAGGSTTTTGAGGSTTTTGAGGSTTTGAGGSTTTGAGGSTTTGAGGAPGGVTSCVPAPKDKSACDLTVATTVTPCTKNCGIKNSGAQKPCACITSTVAAPSPTAWDCSNQGPCAYAPTFDGTCYKLTPAPPACPTTLITTGVTTCTNTAGATCGPLCGSATANSYQDSSMKATIGYCACISGIWQCASAKEWPPQ